MGNVRAAVCMSNCSEVWEDPHWDVGTCVDYWCAWAAPGYGGPPGCMGAKNLWYMKDMAPRYGACGLDVF